MACSYGGKLCSLENKYTEVKLYVKADTQDVFKWKGRL